MADPLSLLTGGLFSTTGLTVTTRGLLSGQDPERTAIRDRVVKKLKAETAAADRVYGSRILPLPEADLPALLVYTQNEPSIEVFAESPRVFDRTLQLIVEIIAMQSDQLDAQLDAIARIVETIVLADRLQGGFARDTLLSSITVQFSEEGAVSAASCQITFNVMYQTSVEDLVGDDLETAQIGWDLAAPDGQKEAEDTITYP